MVKRSRKPQCEGALVNPALLGASSGPARSAGDIGHRYWASLNSSAEPLIGGAKPARDAVRLQASSRGGTIPVVDNYDGTEGKRMNRTLLRAETKYSLGASVCLAAVVGTSMLPTPAHALFSAEIGEHQTFNAMIMARTSFRSFEDGAPDGSSRSNDFTLENMRLLFFGQAAENFTWQLHLDRDANNSVEILDGIVGYEPNSWANFWVGRLIPPNSRTVIAAPFASAPFDFTSAWRFPSKFQGRDDGVMIWGHDPDGKVNYKFSITEGRKGGSNDSDNLLYTGRVSYNFFEGEPGFYPSSFYSGNKRIVALGASFAHQQDGAGTVGDEGDFQAFSVDLRVEWPLANGGSIDFEGGYFDYDLDDVADPTFNAQGDAAYATVGYLLPGTYGPGRLEPRIAYDYFDGDNTNIAAERGKTEKWDLGFRYLPKGNHDIRLSVFYSYIDPPNGSSFNGLTGRVHLLF